MTSNPGSEAAGQTAESAALLQKALAGVALPALRDVLGRSISDLGTPGSEPDSVKKAFGEARDSIQQDYSATNDSGVAAIKQQALQSGQPYNPSAVSATISKFGSGLEEQRAQSQRALSFQEAQAGQNQTNQLLSSINQGAGSVLGGSLRFGQNALQSDQLLSSLYAQNSSEGGAIGGVIGGIVGSYFGPVGTAAGAGLGGLAGSYIGGGG